VTVPLTNPKYRQLELRHGEMRAEIFADPRPGVDSYHYIVQSEDSREPLHWGQEESEGAARDAALARMKLLDKVRVFGAFG
jgi:hypothetical protein